MAGYKAGWEAKLPGEHAPPVDPPYESVLEGEDLDKPVVVQGVQHIFHTPVELDRWPSADTDSRLVFITRNIEADVIRNLFAAVGAVTPAA